MADVIVVGAGIIGLMTAWELQKAGKSVLVLDKGKAGREASWAGGGILSPLGPWRYSDAVQQLAADSQVIYPGLCEELTQISGVDPEWTQSGLLCALDENEFGSGVAWAKEKHANHEVLGASKIRTLYPQLSLAQSALLLKDVAQIRNPRLLQALVKSLSIRRVEVRSNCLVRRLLIENDMVKGVLTDEGEISTSQVVLACGAWTPELIPRAFSRPRIRPVKGQMLLYKTTPGLLTTIVLKNDRYLIPRRDGYILAGSNMEEDGFNKSPTIDVRNEICDFAERLLPALSGITPEAHWTGLRPAIDDDVPAIGAHPELTGLWMNAGHFRYGLTMAPASARKLVKNMLEQATA